MNFITTRVKRDFLDSLARIRRGSLRLITPEGEIHDFGQGLPEAEMQIHDWSVVTALAARGDIGWGETYVAGLWDSPSIDHLTQVALMNRDELTAYADPSPWSNFKFRAVDRILRANSKRGAKRNIKAHYDVGNEFYQLWLDDSMTYSSALFAPGDNDLARAQARKYDRILERSKDAGRILEVGCGWGGFAERAADQGRHVTGITISPSQHGFADARLDGRADIQLRDYRDTEGKFDAIVSIEMIEAVGERYWPQYFHMLKSRLRDGGRAIVQAHHGRRQLFRHLPPRLGLHPPVHLPRWHAAVRCDDCPSRPSSRAGSQTELQVRAGLWPHLCHVVRASAQRQQSRAEIGL